MTRGQRDFPRQWLVADRRLGNRLWRAVAALPSGSGVLFLYRDMPDRDRSRLLSKLRRVARTKGLVIVDGLSGHAARVHSMRELRRAGTAGAALLFLSPMHSTRSHPDWKPLPRMRAATLARLAPAPVIALGGMDARKFSRIQWLGFCGWAGIDAWTRDQRHSSHAIRRCFVLRT